MDRLESFLVGCVVSMIVAPIVIAFNMVNNGRIIMKSIKDEHKNEVLYYVDIYTDKTYKEINNILYYYEED